MTMDASLSAMRAPRKVVVEIGIGIGCGVAMLAIMMALLVFTPLPAPFLFAPPIVMLATLYARWPAGLAALITALTGIGLLFALYPGQFEMIAPSHVTRFIIAAFVGLALLVLTESFRLSVLSRERAAKVEIAQRDMLLRELEHRTRNNLTLITNLLSLQRRQSSSAEVASALDQAAARVHTITDAYDQLSHVSEEGGEIEMAIYLERLLNNLASGLFSDRIHVEHDIAEMAFPASKAVAVGLYLNEALTNCAKHAFPHDSAGKVRVLLREQDDEGGWRLTIIDDGIGRAIVPEAVRKKAGGLGSILFEALATQAGARHQVTLLDPGRRLDLISAA